MSSAKWYYLDSGKQRQGPFGMEELLQLIAARTIDGRTLVWCSGMKDWCKLEDAEEIMTRSSAAENPQTNLLTQRFGNIGTDPARAMGRTKSALKFVKFGAITALLAGLIWANKAFLLLPGSGGAVESDLADRWFSDDNREGVIIQCTFDKKGLGPSGKPRYRVSALVSAGVARKRILPTDRTGTSQVIIMDADGREILNQAVSNAKLCPS